MLRIFLKLLLIGLNAFLMVVVVLTFNYVLIYHSLFDWIKYLWNSGIVILLLLNILCLKYV